MNTRLCPDHAGSRATITTPLVMSPDEIPIGGRGTLDGRRVLYRHACGVVLDIGRPWAVGQTLDDVVFRRCPRCDGAVEEP